MISYLTGVVDAANEAIKIQDVVTAQLLKRAAKRMLQNAFTDTKTTTKYFGTTTDGSAVGVTENEVNIGRTQGKIKMIQAVRDRLGLTLSDSKMVVETVFDTHGFYFKY